ncbi:MAG: sigma-54-dependent Fis family transcriptional regulator [Gammaproteobacteria bacterium]|nr:sigma-54-dependent Fis family transcriptional regulator [Gammaproteobacteria bacterium]
MKILVVEDEFEQRQLVQQILNKFTDYSVDIVSSAEKAIKYLEQNSIDIILSDWKLTGMDGLELLEQVKQTYSNVSFILMTAYGSISHAVTSMRAGADDYIAKPFDKEQLLFTLNKVVKNRSLIFENESLNQQVVDKKKLGNIIGSSKEIQKLYDQIDKLADTDVTVLIHGESGTGKELVAHTLHEKSQRSSNTYLAVNCSAIPESLAESELFGAEKGAFTSADKQMIGKIEAANNGTLFLDEVAELPMSIQAKLLRFLQEGKIMRVGGNVEIPVNVRVIAASHKSLSEQVEKGLFREDLYYRLNVITLTVPPLRARLDDLPSLLSYFSKKFSDKYNKPQININEDCMKVCYEYHWPGNIRELSNMVERLTVMISDRAVAPSDLPFSQAVKMNANAYEIPSQGIDWESFEKQILEQALEKTNLNRTKAAKLLGLPYKAFLYRLEKYGVQSK